MAGPDQKETGSGPLVETLVHQARAGSRAAFEQIMILYQEQIFRMAYYRTRSRMDAEDLTQDIFMQAFKNLSRLQEVERFKGWLFSVASNRVRDFHRKKRFRALFFRRPDQDDPVEEKGHTDAPPDALRSLMTQDFWRKIGAFLDRLPHMEREVFILRFMDHLTIREVSQVLSKSESTVKTHLYRSLKKFKRENSLRQFLQELLP